MLPWYRTRPPVQGSEEDDLGREDPLEKEKATGSSILAWRIPWTEEPGGLQSRRSPRVGHDWASEHTVTHSHRRALILIHVFMCFSPQSLAR